MIRLNLLFYEWKHFIRSPFKIVALSFFIAAGLYGLHNGANLYQEQLSEIEKIEEKAEGERQQFLKRYDHTPPKRGADKPVLAIWFGHVYYFKQPSSALVYNIGQTEQYGFYKWVNLRASPYDADLAAEITNQERLQIGTLDFTFALIFLLPLLFIIFTYDLKSFEHEQGFLPLIRLQIPQVTVWIASRILFYFILVFLTTFLLMLYGAFLTSVFENETRVFWQFTGQVLLYTLFWTLLFFLILNLSKTILGNSLTMLGIWVMLAFIIPAAVLQWVSLSKPANLMTDLLDVRDARADLYDQPDSLLQAQLFALFPEIVDSPVARDSTQLKLARNPGAYALVNELKKERIRPIELENEAKNDLIRFTYWFNPLTFFQNKFNKLTQTHYHDYQDYRADIQNGIDDQIRTTIIDTWNEVKVDKDLYLNYYKNFKQTPD